MRRTFRRARSAAREQLKYIFARQPRRASDVLPSDSDFIDVNTLLTTLSVEDLNRTSEEYYRQHPDLVGTSADRSRLRTRAPASRVTTGRVRHVLFCDRRAPPGEYRMDFDLVSEQVCWFADNGAKVVRVDVSVR